LSKKRKGDFEVVTENTKNVSYSNSIGYKKVKSTTGNIQKKT
jgi:hypothetical protein